MEVEHTADAAFVVEGKNFEEIIEKAVLELSSFIGEAGGGRKIEVSVERTGDLGFDLAKVLNEIIYLAEAENFLPKKAKAEVGKNKIKLVLFGGDAKINKEVKAVAYNAEVFEEKGKLKAKFICDL